MAVKSTEVGVGVGAGAGTTGLWDDAKGATSVTLADIDDSRPKFEPLPQGKHLLEITEETEFTTSSNGNDMIRLVLKVPSGEFKGRKVWDHFVDSKTDDNRTGLKNLKRFLRAVFDGDDSALENAFSSSLTAIPDLLTGRMVAANITHEKYQGEPKAKVAYYLPAAAVDPSRVQF